MSVGSTAAATVVWLNGSGESHCYHCNQRLDAEQLVAGLAWQCCSWSREAWGSGSVTRGYLLRLGGSPLTTGASGAIFGLMGAEIGFMSAGVGDHHTRSTTRDSAAGSPGNLGWRAAWWVCCQSAVSTLRSAAKISRPERT